MGNKKNEKKKSDKETKHLRKTYFDARGPGSLGGVRALSKAAGLNESKTRRWLTFEDAYTLHKPIVRRFERRKTIASSIDAQWQADLMDLRKIRKDNDGFVFVLVVVDILSRYAFVRPLKDKTGNSVVEAFADIFKRGRRRPLKLQTDAGTEFTNRTFQNFLKKENVGFFVTQNRETKASIAERFIRTFKNRMWRYFTREQTYRYVDKLQDLVKGYNRSFHSSIRMAPELVTSKNQDHVFDTLYNKDIKSRRKESLRVGDNVRLSKPRKTFSKGYESAWTEEIFFVSEVLRTTPRTYRVLDSLDEPVIGSFYAEELNKIGPKEVFRINAILRSRRASNGHKEFLVSWRGYPAEFDSWVDERAMTKYPR